jgi:hypothetical protein
VRGIKNIISFLLVLVLFMPTVVKLNHHHDHGGDHEKQSSSTTHFTHKCVICDFQFPAFTGEGFTAATAPFHYGDFQTNLYSQSSFTGDSQYSFLLRAPPVLHFA